MKSGKGAAGAAALVSVNPATQMGGVEGQGERKGTTLQIVAVGAHLWSVTCKPHPINWP